MVRSDKINNVVGVAQRAVAYVDRRLGLDAGFYAKQSFWTSLGQVFQIIFGIATTVFFARLATKEVFGQYQLLLSFIGLVSILSLPGLNISILRSLAQGYEGTYAKGIRLSFVWSLLGVPVLLLVAGYFFSVHDSTMGWALVATAFFFPGYWAPNTWINYYQARSQFKRLTIYETIHGGAVFLAVAAALWLSAGSLLITVISYFAVHVFFNVYFHLRTLPLISNQREDPGWIRQGLAMTLLSFVSLAYNNVDKLIIGMFLSVEQLAGYAIAVALINKIRMAFKAFNRVLFPRLARLDRETMRRRIKRRAPLAIVGLLLLTVLLYLVMPSLIHVLFSAKYNEAIFYSRLYLVTLPFAFFMTLFSHVFVSLKQERLLTKIQIISVIINLVLYIVLIPLLGVIGAIISSIIYFIFFTIIAAAVWWRQSAPKRP